MSAPVLPQNANVTPATSSSTLPGGTNTSATASPPSEPFRFGEAAPPWARGKSAEEVLGITENLMNTFQRYGTTSATAPPAPAPAAVAPPTVGDDDYITGKDMRALLERIANERVAPQLAQSIDMAASANLAMVRQQHAVAFQRYGPEIVTKLASVPKNLWTLDNLETVVKLVKVDHIDELAREQAQTLVSTMEPTIRSSGAGGSVLVPTDKAHSLESEVIPAEWKQRAQRAGVTERVVQEFCVANDITPIEFYKQFDHLAKYEGQRNPIVAEVSRRETTAG